MADIQKYNLKDELLDADKRLMGSASLLGMNALTQPAYNNSMRTVMFTSHLKQFVNLLEPEFPKFFTNAENLVGKHSSGYKKIKSDMSVYKKIVKYEGLVPVPTFYLLFLFDKKNGKFHVVTREPSENLTENFGFDYNNQEIDLYEEGDSISKGTVIKKSTSYDEDMNYAYGKNVTTLYSLDPGTAEDACIVSRSLANSMLSIEIETIPIHINDNDFLLNMFGDSDEYKVIPDIGELFDGIVAVSRRLINNQLLHDFKDNNLSEIHEGDTIYFSHFEAEVIDINIFSNNEEPVRNSFNSQLLDYLDAQTKYYEDVYKTTKKIMNSGLDYSRDIEYLFKRSKEFLDKEKKWKDGDSSFSNMEIEVTIRRIVPLRKGQKITGRYGNKSVISEIREDEDMPYTETGKRVQLIESALGIVNRTTGFVPMEMSINFICNRTRERMATLSTLKEKEELLFDIIYMFNEKEYKQLKVFYNSLNAKGKQEFIQDAIDNGIYIHQPPLWETKPIFYRLRDIYAKYDWLQPYTMFIKKWGHHYECLSKVYLGEMYIIKLKQSDRRGFSVRSTGAVNTKGLPERSYKSRNHLELNNSAAIRFGEFETLNFAIGMSTEDIALFHAENRTSIKGRRDLAKSVFEDPLSEDDIEVDETLTSRVAEIFHVELKSLGIGLKFVDEDDFIEPMSKNNLELFDDDDGSFLMSEYDHYIKERTNEIRDRILLEHGMMESDDLNQLVAMEIASHGFIFGDKK